MGTRGTVREWRSDEGWGVIDSQVTPGGCWTHFSHLRMPGYRPLRAGQSVELEWERPGQDGYPFRAVQVWLPGYQPRDTGPHSDEPSAAYRSKLSIDWRENPKTGRS
jgi:cold shock protein